MRFGLISDIHGNLEALDEVLDRLGKANVDQIICLGDIIGYGPDPELCLERVRDHASLVIAGNHDHAPIGLVDTRFFNPYAQKAVSWTKVRLSEEWEQYLQELPLVEEVENMTCVHASPGKPDSWSYIVSIQDAADNFVSFKNLVCFIGHSHVPIVIEKDGNNEIAVIRKYQLELQQDCQYIINIGSVGQPRDGDPRSSYVILDDKEVHFRRVEYDPSETRRKIQEIEELDDFLGDRLLEGR